MALGRSPLPPLPTGFSPNRPSRQISVTGPLNAGQTGPVGLGPTAATGPRQLVPLVSPISYPSAPVGFGPSNTASSPRFQYPNGVMAPLPAAERRRFLIGILAIAFVAVGAGIVMALVHGGGDEIADARSAPAGNAAPAAEPTAVASNEPAVTAPATDGAAQPAVEAGTAAAGQPAASTQPAVADLRGDRPLPPADFGTDEQFLSGVTGADTSGEEDPAPDTTEATDDEAEREATRERRERRRERRRAREEAELAGASTDDTATDDEGEGTDDTSSGPTIGATTALRQAEALYKQKRFSEAANLLRRAADSASRRDVGRLRTLAQSYGKIGSLLAEGQASTVSDAPRALQAFKSALRLDEEFGDSEHDRTIGARIAQVAPAAAAAYMARKDYPEAKAAADIAEKFGSGDADRVRIVRASLERKAEQLYEEARTQSDSGEPEAAAQTARIILRMVPRSSAVYAKAAKLAGQ
jgi:tetratricopeptide (TPR) repeat protein